MYRNGADDNLLATDTLIHFGCFYIIMSRGQLYNGYMSPNAELPLSVVVIRSRVALIELF